MAEMEISPGENNNQLALITPETQPMKRRKKKSMVWEYFTIEIVSGCRNCKRCKQSFAYRTGSKVARASHLKRLIAKGTCPALLRGRDNNKMGGSESPKWCFRSSSTSFFPYDQDRCRHEIARMIIMHEYPLHMVKHPGFIAFVRNLQPQFDKMSFNTVQGDCVATYLREKQSLMKFIKGIPGRFCLTLDMWSSNQTLGYVFITGHFVDMDWKLHRRVFNVIMEPYQDSHCALIMEPYQDSHCALSEARLENLRPLLCVKNPLILNGQLLIGNCIAHTMSSMAKDVLRVGEEVIKKIRDSVKHVKMSESHYNKFVQVKNQLQVPSEKLFLDDQTQRNTTIQVLAAASELKEVFDCFDTSIITTAIQPTAVTLFHEVWRIHADLGRSTASEDPFISNLAKSMHEKIDKYRKDCSLVLAIAVVMDPRFKMKLVVFSFTKIYGEDVPAYIKTVDGIHELLNTWHFHFL
ncbi:Zinc finger BED domain-containing protein DAYSLEEPER [Hibiscus syriacus]|uniref:Zinc finger BED domain-containing protein DAYSLEEPER n=1 Tax=Hibiscus syriacus TaxID=106335 RepID=A0A6A2ZC14_HIBSY|nr:Zinc finger BED domain-containing protein DAYSLEEPER [Hibiscus syriacus]